MLAADPNLLERERARRRQAARWRCGQRARKPEGFRASVPGECVAPDTIVRRGRGQFGYLAKNL